MADPYSIFICYAREGDALREELRQHLRGLERQGIVRVWSDQLIGLGTDWRTAIRDEKARDAAVRAVAKTM